MRVKHKVLRNASVSTSEGNFAVGADGVLSPDPSEEMCARLVMLENFEAVASAVAEEEPATPATKKRSSKVKLAKKKA